MPSTAIRITDLSKSYSIQHENGHRATNLREAIAAKLRKPFQRAETEEFWALKDINVEINKGEVVGVIGRNGAGKSTLLKILSRITEPTAGKIELFGRVGSLLEVGTGFHPELTGRENVFLNGAILGMRRPEIRKQFDAIVDFAGVEKFLDTPVKRYSSGMYVRLAFAVAAHLNPEILIVDEVLAVGDQLFQEKCIGKMRQVADGGRTVVIVSHQLTTIQLLCKTSVLLKNGTIASVGATEDIIAAYTKNLYSTNYVSSQPANTEINISDLCFAENKTEDGRSGTWRFTFNYELKGRSKAKASIVAKLLDEFSRPISALNTLFDCTTLELQTTGKIACFIEELPLVAGPYSIDLTVLFDGTNRSGGRVVLSIVKAVTFVVSANSQVNASHLQDRKAAGCLAIKQTWQSID